MPCQQKGRPRAMTEVSTEMPSRKQGRPGVVKERILTMCTSGWRRTVSYYVVALVTVGLGTALRIGLDPVLGEHHPFTIYFAAVAITAWYGGFAPALAATALAYFAADWFFVPPRFAINWPHGNLDEF